MNSKRKLIFISLVLTILMAAGTVFAAASQEDQYMDTSDNLFFSGTEKIVEGGLFFAGYGAGKDLSVTNSKSKDSLALAGMNLSVENTKAGSSVYLAGQTISVRNTEAGGNIMAAGQKITVDKNTSCNGAYVTGQNIVFNGTAKAMGLGSETASFNGNITGDASINADKVVIGKNAVVTGTMKIETTKKPVIENGAKIGKLDIKIVKKSKYNTVVPSLSQRFLNSLKSALYWAAAMILLGLLLFLIGRHHMERAGEMIRTRPGKMLGSGAITLIVMPIAAVLCLITVVGAPAGLFTGLVYTLCILISTAFTGASLGPVVLKKMRFLPAALLGIVALELIEAIPYLGGLVQLAAILFTLGYLIQLIYLGRIKKKTVAAPYSVQPDVPMTGAAVAEAGTSAGMADDIRKIEAEPIHVNTDQA